MITYKKGYKYQLKADYTVDTGITGYDIDNEYIVLSEEGTLTIRKGYAWDGPSGPAIDTKDFMRGSLIHDALYQLMREQEIAIAHRKDADDIMYKCCLEDGMSKFRAWYCYQTVRMFGRSNTMSFGGYPIKTAP